MEDGNIEKGPASRPEWEHLEEWLRGRMQGLIQELLEQEVTEFLGRARSVRRSESDNDTGYRKRLRTASTTDPEFRDYTGQEASGTRESNRSWSEVLRDLRRRGLNCPRLVVGDGHLGIWGALRNVWPEAGEQRCWNHKILNMLDKLPKRQYEQGRLMLRSIPYAETRAEAERLRAAAGTSKPFPSPPVCRPRDEGAWSLRAACLQGAGSSSVSMSPTTRRRERKSVT